ncbi:hypothetical protein T03_6553 [Trichinella britovi]|uniref:Uncharacterized protein n=1 Tax=Trichinella britovi TaxID=45882 RepID=A0A0V1CMQ6_TRIBR|nr:hypothetical protein T03_6553 [Trichinella britovi]
MSNELLPLWNAHNVNIRSNNHLKGWHNWMDKKVGGNKLWFYKLLQLLIEETNYKISRWINRAYTEKQRLIIRYTGDYTSGRHTLEQFFEALIPSPEQI